MDMHGSANTVPAPAASAVDAAPPGSMAAAALAAAAAASAAGQTGGAHSRRRDSGVSSADDDRQQHRRRHHSRRRSHRSSRSQTREILKTLGEYNIEPSFAKDLGLQPIVWPESETPVVAPDSGIHSAPHIKGRSRSAAAPSDGSASPALPAPKRSRKLSGEDEGVEMAESDAASSSRSSSRVSTRSNSASSLESAMRPAPSAAAAAAAASATFSSSSTASSVSTRSAAATSMDTMQLRQHQSMVPCESTTPLYGDNSDLLVVPAVSFVQSPWKDQLAMAVILHEGAAGKAELDLTLRSTAASPDSPKDPAGFDYFSILSDEILLNIFSFVRSRRTLGRCACVSRDWRRIVYDDSLWRLMSISLREFSTFTVLNILRRNPRKARITECVINRTPLPADFVFPRLAMNTLDLSSTVLDDETFCEIIKCAPNLVKLDLGNTELSSAAVQAIAKYCPKLESACLRMMPKLDDDAVIAVVKQCKSLQTLSLAWTQLTATGLSALAEYGKELRHLDVSGSREDLTDEGVEQLTLLCTKLLTLDLSDCYALTDASINHIVLNSPCISHVSLSRCHNITVAGMRTLAAKNTLQSINLFGCYSIVFPHIKEVCAHLLINERMLSHVPACVDDDPEWRR